MHQAATSERPVFEERSLFEYLFVLLRYWWLVLIVTLLVGGWSIYDFKHTRPLYRTSTAMISPSVDRASGWITLESLNDPKMQLDRLSGEVRLEIVQKILESWDTKVLVADTLDLVTHYGMDDSFLATQELDDATSLALNKNESILTMQVVDHSPAMAVKIADTYIQCLKRRNAELTLTSESSMVKVIERPFRPRFRYRPSLKVSAILGVVLSAGTSIFLVVMIELIRYLFRFKRRQQQQRGTAAA